MSVNPRRREGKLNEIMGHFLTGTSCGAHRDPGLLLERAIAAVLKTGKDRTNAIRQSDGGIDGRDGGTGNRNEHGVDDVELSSDPAGNLIRE